MEEEKEDEKEVLSDLIKRDSLVAVINSERNPAIQLGLVLNGFPSGKTFNVRIGPEDGKKIIAKTGEMVLLIQTDGKFNDPKEAFVHYLNDIVIELAIAMRLSRELREIQRLKNRAIKINRKLRHRIATGMVNMLSRIVRYPPHP